jgi:hypothetical protein
MGESLKDGMVSTEMLCHNQHLILKIIKVGIINTLVKMGRHQWALSKNGSNS